MPKKRHGLENGIWRIEQTVILNVSMRVFIVRFNETFLFARYEGIVYIYKSNRASFLIVVKEEKHHTRNNQTRANYSFTVCIHGINITDSHAPVCQRKAPPPRIYYK